MFSYATLFKYRKLNPFMLNFLMYLLCRSYSIIMKENKNINIIDNE